MMTLGPQPQSAGSGILQHAKRADFFAQPQATTEFPVPDSTGTKLTDSFPRFFVPAIDGLR
jgi:hypothetical protein